MRPENTPRACCGEAAVGQNWQGLRRWPPWRRERKGRRQMSPDLRHGVSIIFRDRDFWKLANLSGVPSEATLDCTAYWGSI